MFTTQPKRELWDPCLSVAERMAAGKELRRQVARAAHAEFKPTGRANPIQLLIESNEDRLPELLPIRYARMLQSPFAFLRGSAVVMASDLSTTPSSGIEVQCCGDCHLMNFGVYATPERHLVFDINDFDETSPAPWEWDLKRLAASIVVAARYRGFSEKVCRRVVLSATTTYRDKIRNYASMRTLEIWYNRLDESSVRDAFVDDREIVKKFNAVTTNARLRIHDHVFPKLLQVVNGKAEIKDEPPLIYHERDTNEKIERAAEFFLNYRGTLPDHMKSLFDRYQLMDVAMKVVGVGSVGTRCLIGLFMGENDDPLFLQFKEARASVLESYTQKSAYENHGARIVNGQRLLQTVSDIFLGWTTRGDGKQFYVRHLKEIKGSTNLDSQDVNVFHKYVTICAWALAKSHAKSGGAPEIAGYIGKSDELPEAIADFAFVYADQTETDYEALKMAERDGVITRTEEIF